MNDSGRRSASDALLQAHPRDGGRRLRRARSAARKDAAEDRRRHDGNKGMKSIESHIGKSSAASASASGIRLEGAVNAVLPISPGR